MKNNNKDLFIFKNNIKSANSVNSPWTILGDNSSNLMIFGCQHFFCKL